MGDLILYTSDDGQTRLQLRADGQTVWLTQLEIAELFQTTKNNISIHTKKIFQEGELVPAAVVKQSLTTAADGKKYRTKLFNLDLILAIGYRVRSPRGTQFRQWATTHLREFIVKGFVMDDERLKDPGKVSHDSMKRIAHERFETFDQRRREAGALAADAEDLAQLEQLEQDLKQQENKTKK